MKHNALFSSKGKSETNIIMFSAANLLGPFKSQTLNKSVLNLDLYCVQTFN